MTVLLVVGVGVVLWLGACTVVVALCMSAKEGDRPDTALAEEFSAQRQRTRARLPALPRPMVPRSRAWRVT